MQGTFSRHVSSAPSPAPFGCLLAPRQKRQWAHSHTPCSTASFRSLPCLSSAVGRDPRGLEPRGLEPRGLEPRVMEARALEARGLEPRVLEPRVLEARAMRPGSWSPGAWSLAGLVPTRAARCLVGYRVLGHLTWEPVARRGPARYTRLCSAGRAPTASCRRGLGGGCPTEQQLWEAPGFGHWL